MEKLQQLHGLLTSEGLEKGDFASFVAKFKDPAKQAELHKFVQDEYGEKKDLATWQSEFFSEKKNAAPVSSQGSGVGSQTASTSTTEPIEKLPELQLSDIPKGISMDTKSILDANKGKPFVDRILNPKAYPALPLGNGDVATHKMSYAEADGKFYAFPAVQYDPKTKKLTDLSEAPDFGAFKSAMKTGDVIPFKTEQEAKLFTEHYKEGTPLEAMYGGPIKQGTAPMALKATDGKQSITDQGVDEAYQQYRQGVLSDVTQGLSRLAAQKGIDGKPWESVLTAQLNNPNVKTQKERDVLALQLAYKIFKDNGVERNGITTPGQGIFGEESLAGGVMDAASGVGMVARGVQSEDAQAMQRTWEHLAKAEQDLRDEDPSRWSEMKGQEKVAHYAPILGKDIKESDADGALIATGLKDPSALGMDEDMGKEASLRLEARHWQEAADKFQEQYGDTDPRKPVAEVEQMRIKAKVAQDQADAIFNQRHGDLVAKRAKIAELMDDTNLSTFQRKTLQQAMSAIDAEELGFIDPSYRFAKVEAAYGPEAAKATGGVGTPQEQMRKYLGNLMFEQKQLKDRILMDQGAFQGAARELSGATYRGWNADEERLAAVSDKIRAISPVVLLNERPEHKTGLAQTIAGYVALAPVAAPMGIASAIMGKNYGDIAGRSFLSTMLGSGSQMGGTIGFSQRSDDMRNVEEMLQSSGISDHQVINPIYKGKFEEDMTPIGAAPDGSSLLGHAGAFFSLEHAAELGGMLSAMSMQSRAGGEIMKSFGAGRVLKEVGSQVAAGTRGAKFAKVALTALERGASYEITGDIFKNQDDFFNFTTGLVGGAVEGATVAGIGVTKNISGKMFQRLGMLFGRETPEAARWITQYGKTLQEFQREAAGRVGTGMGTVAGQVAEGNIRHLQSIGGSPDMAGALNGIHDIFEKSDVRAEYWDKMQQQFGHTFGERVKFFGDMFLMGLVMGGGHQEGLGRDLTNRAREIYGELEGVDQQQAQEILQSAGELASIHEEVAHSQGADQFRDKPADEPVAGDAEPTTTSEPDNSGKTKMLNDAAIVGYDAHKAITDGNATKAEVVVGADGKPEVVETPFGEEDLQAELDRLEILAERGKLTHKEFLGSFIGSHTDNTTAGIVKAHLEADPVGFMAHVRKIIEAGLKSHAEEKAKVEAEKAATTTAEPVVQPSSEPVTDAEKAKQMQTLADRINAGEDPKEVLKGMPDNYAEAVKDLAKQRKKGGSSQAAPLPEAPAESPVSPPSEPTAVEAPTPPIIPPPVQEAAGGGQPPVIPPVEPVVPPVAETPPPGKGLRSVLATLANKKEIARIQEEMAKPGTTDAERAALQEKLDKMSPTDFFKQALDKVNKYYQKTTHSAQFADALEALGYVKNAKGEYEVTEDVGKKIDKLLQTNQRTVETFADTLAQRLVAAKFLGEAGDMLAKEMDAETNPDVKAEIQAEFDDIMGKQAEMMDRVASMGTIGGQGISFIGFWKSMYEHPMAVTRDYINNWNKNHEREVRPEIEATQRDMANIRNEIGNDVANEMGGEGKPKEKSKPSSSRQIVARAKASIDESLAALGKTPDFLKPKNGKPGVFSTGLVGATLVLGAHGAHKAYHLAKIGVNLVRIGAVRFADWTAGMHEKVDGIMKVSDKELQDLWETASIDGGLTPKEESRLAIQKASVAPEAKKKAAETLRQQIQQAFKDGGDIKQTLMDRVKLSAEEADFAMKEGQSVIDGTAKELAKQRAAKTEASISQKERQQQKALEKQQERIDKSRRAEQAQKIKQIFDESVAETSDKPMVERLVNEAGMTPAEADSYMLATAGDWADAAKKRLLDAAEPGKKPTAAATETFRQKVQGAIADFYRNPNKGSVEDRLLGAGLDQAQVDIIMDAHGATFADGAMQALKDAAKEGTPAKKGEPTLRKRIQDAFNYHYSLGNTESISLKERLMRQPNDAKGVKSKGAGLTEEQADIVLQAEADQIAKRDQKLVTDILGRQDALDQAEHEKTMKANVKRAISDHFSSNTMAKVVAKLLGAETAGTPEERKAIEDQAKKAAVFGKLRLLNGKTVTEEMLVDKLVKNVGMEEGQARDVAKAMMEERGKTLLDRIKERTGLDGAEAQALADEAKAKFDERAKAHVEARVKALKGKPPREQVHRSKSDVDRALELMLDGEMTDDQVRDVLADKFGFAQQLSPENLAAGKKLAAALAAHEAGSIFELDAARKLDRFFDAMLPRDKAGIENLARWKALSYGNMLNGYSTSLVNILSGSSMALLQPIVNLGNWSEYFDAARQGIKAGAKEKAAGSTTGGAVKKGLQVAARATPVTAAVVRYSAIPKGFQQGRMLAADAFLHGYIDSKFLEGSNSPLGRQMSILERRNWDPFGDRAKALLSFKKKGWKGAYSWLIKYSGRNLAAQDVFLRTIGHQMQLADMIRRGDVETTKSEMEAAGFVPKNLQKLIPYSEWVRFRMSLDNNPKFAGLVMQAGREVFAHDEMVGGMSDAQKSRMMRVRVRELVDKNLGLSENARQAAIEIARSQIFTHDRHGINSKMADMLGFVKTKAPLLWPILPFLKIVGNIGDTVADFNPLSAIPRANGMSISELLDWYSRLNMKPGEERARSTARLSERTKVDGNTWLQNALKESKDPRYYEQMSRAWGGIHTLIGMAAMMGTPSAGLWIDDDGDVSYDGNHLFATKEFPVLAPSARMLGHWMAYAQNNPGEEGAKDLALRTGYTLFGGEMAPIQTSVFQSGLTLMDVIGHTIRVMQEKDEMGSHENFNPAEELPKLIEEVAKPFLAAYTKPLPWRAGIVEQSMQIWDQGKYPHKTLMDSFEYYASGAFYKYKPLSAVGDKIMGKEHHGAYIQRDAFGDEVKALPAENTIQALDDFINDVANRPWVKFMTERGIRFPQTPNPTVAWVDPNSPVGVVMDKYDDEQYDLYVRESGAKFKEMVSDMINNGAATNPDGSLVIGADGKVMTLDYMDNYMIPGPDKKLTTITKVVVGKMLSASRAYGRAKVAEKYKDSHVSPIKEQQGDGQFMPAMGPIPVKR